jgi:hypothetical protein
MLRRLNPVRDKHTGLSLPVLRDWPMLMFTSDTRMHKFEEEEEEEK